MAHFVFDDVILQNNQCSIPTSLLSFVARTCCFVARCLLHPYSPCLDDKNLSEDFLDVCFFSAIQILIIAAMPPGGIPSCPMAVHPVCPDCPSLGNARRDLAELHPEHSPSWRCPPGCRHCFHMGRPTNLIPQTPLMCHSVYSQMCLHTPKRPRPVWCKVLNEKFTKWQRWSNWQRQYETTAKWQRWPIGG